MSLRLVLTSMSSIDGLMTPRFKPLFPRLMAWIVYTSRLRPCVLCLYPGILGRVFLVECKGFEEGIPIMIQLLQDLLTHFSRKCLVCFVRLHTPVHLIVVEVLSRKNVGLAYLVVCSIVQVLRLEGSGINHSVP